MKLTCRLGWHEWKPTGQVQDVFDAFSRSDLPKYQKQVFRCEHCGRLRSRKI